MKKAVLYLNQFFGQIGGEDKADYKPEVIEGSIGAAIALNSYLKDVEVTHTIICGDNFMGSNQDEAVETIINELENIDFDIFVAGPAFQAGRYGSACGVMCKAVKDKFNVPVITSMHEENPGVDMFKNELIILKGGKSAAAMRKNMKKVADYINKVVEGKPILSAEEEGYFERGIRHQVWLDSKKTVAERTVEMLVNKVNDKKFETELIIPVSEKVEIAKPIENLKEATIAIVNTGGIVPVDNPDRIQSASATRWGKYNIEGMDRLKAGEFKTIHAGFDPTVANNNPNVITPVDVLRQYESEGKIGKLHEYIYSTVGTGTTQAEASRMGKEIAEYLLEAKVDGVLLVSTWGTCTRCGAAMTKAIEKTGIAITQIANLTPIAKTVGSNRIAQSFSIPYPMGDPGRTEEEQYKLRQSIVSKALKALETDIKEQTIYKLNV